MKAAISLLWSIFLCFFLSACTKEPSSQEALRVVTPDPEPYLYKPPTPPANGLAFAKLKNEALAEAFVSRLSTKAPAGVVVMQQEKLVLEEYFSLDSTRFVCVDALFPPYAGAMLASTATYESGMPNQAVPLQLIYPHEGLSSALSPTGSWPVTNPEQELNLIQQLDVLIQKQSGTSHGMAAEEFLFEPLQIDDYTWIKGKLCLHPHAILQLGSLWVRRGRWAEQQVLPDDVVNRVLQPAYDKKVFSQKTAFGWHYYRLMAKGRKQPVLYWKGHGAHLFLLPEIETVILLQGNEALMQDAWPWLQQYLIPSLT